MNHFDFINEYRAVTSHFPNHTARPVIGITEIWTPRGDALWQRDISVAWNRRAAYP